MGRLSKTTPKSFLHMLFAIGLVFTLSACAEDTETEDEMGADTDTAMSSMEGTEDDMEDMDTQQPSSQVSVQSTISALQGGVTSMAASAAVQNINGWQQRLQNTNVAGASEIESTLGDLKEALQEQPIDGEDVGEMLTELGDQTTQAAQNAQGATANQLNQLGSLLSQAGQKLTGGGGM